MDYHKSYAISMFALEKIVIEIQNYDSELKEVRTASPPDWVGGFKYWEFSLCCVVYDTVIKPINVQYV